MSAVSRWSRPGSTSLRRALAGEGRDRAGPRQGPLRQARDDQEARHGARRPSGSCARSAAGDASDVPSAGAIRPTSSDDPGARPRRRLPLGSRLPPVRAQRVSGGSGPRAPRAGSRSTSPAPVSVERCLATAWRVIGSSAVSAGTEVEPSRISVSSICRRVGSASAPNTSPSWSLTRRRLEGRRQLRHRHHRRLRLGDGHARAAIGYRDDARRPRGARARSSLSRHHHQLMWLGRSVPRPRAVRSLVGLEPALAALVGGDGLPHILERRFDRDLSGHVVGFRRGVRHGVLLVRRR